MIQGVQKLLLQKLVNILDKIICICISKVILEILLFSYKDSLCLAGGLSDSALESKVEKWIKVKTGVDLKFDSSEAVKLLKSFGILSEAQQKLNVLPLVSAARCLPITPQSLIARSTEADITEGYDRNEYLETEHDYKEEDRRSRRYGWF